MSGATANITRQDDPKWWAEWKRRILARGRMEGKVRFTFARVLDVDERQQEFSAHVRVECKIHNVRERFGEIPRRLSVGGGLKTNWLVTAGSDIYFEEFDPKLIFSNLKRAQFPVTRWTRRDDPDSLTFCVEAHGWFGVPVRFFNYPIDTQELTVQVTSDWSDEFLVLRTSMKHQFNVADQYEMKREYELCEGVVVQETENASTKGKKYSQVNGSVLVKRKSFGMFMLLSSKPLALTSLGFCIAALMPTDQAADNQQLLNDRLNIVLILLLASTVAKSSTTFIFLDYYTAGAFFILFGLCLESVLVFSNIVPTDQQYTADVVGLAILGAIWTVMNVWMTIRAVGWHLSAELRVRAWKHQVSGILKAEADKGEVILHDAVQVSPGNE